MKRSHSRVLLFLALVSFLWHSATSHWPLATLSQVHTQTHTHTHARTHAPPPPLHTHTCRVPSLKLGMLSYSRANVYVRVQQSNSVFTRLVSFFY